MLTWYGDLTPEHGHLDCRGCTFTAQSCLFLWIHHYHSWHKCITMYTANSNSNMGQISHDVPIPSELCSSSCNPHYHPPLVTTIRLSWLVVDGWTQQNLKIDTNAKRSSWLCGTSLTLWGFLAAIKQLYWMVQSVCARNFWNFLIITYHSYWES